jgi:hypothetical protein
LNLEGSRVNTLLPFCFLEGTKVPEIARFNGSVIAIYYADHPEPHFHVLHGEYEAVVSIAKLEVTEGCLAPATKRRVLKWASKNQESLQELWKILEKGDPVDIQQIKEALRE